MRLLQQLRSIATLTGTGKEFTSVPTENRAEVRAFVGNNVRSNDTELGSRLNLFPVRPHPYRCLPLPNVRLLVLLGRPTTFGDPSKLVNFRKHAVMTSSGYGLQKLKKLRQSGHHLHRLHRTYAPSAHSGSPRWIWMLQPNERNATYATVGFTSIALCTWANRSTSVSKRKVTYPGTCCLSTR